MRPSSLRQYLGAETLPSSQGKQPRASAELDYQVSTSTPCLPLPRRTLLLHLTGKAGLSLLHSLWGLWSLVLPEPEVTPGQRPAGYLLCGEGRPVSLPSLFSFFCPPVPVGAGEAVGPELCLVSQLIPTNFDQGLALDLSPVLPKKFF